MTKDEALKLAMEKFEFMNHVDSIFEGEFDFQINAIKEALMSGTDGAQPEKERPSFAEWTSDYVQDNLHKLKPEQEPVAWRYKILDYFGRPVWTLKTPKTDIRVLESQPLYTTPPQRTWVGLMDEEIILIVAECASSHQHTDIHFARAIERAHGIIAPTELKGEA